MKYYDILYRTGKMKKNIVYEAPNRQSAISQFRNSSLGVMVNIKECQEPLSLKWKKFRDKQTSPIRKKRVNQEQYIAFLDQLATMLDAGMPINDCLNQCVEDASDKMVKAIFEVILDDIESGQSLTQSASKFKFQLTNLTLSLFELGEQTGTLAGSVKKLADILQQIHDNRQKFKKATRYPLVIIVAMIIAFSVVITWVVPQFESFFQEAGLKLPYPTRFLLWTEDVLSTYGLYILTGSILLAIFFGYMYSKSAKWKFHTDRLLLKVYIVGDVTYYAMIGRFVYLFEVLSDAGIPMIDAITISRGVIDNSFLDSKLEAIPRAIEDGKSLTQGFKESEQFENMVVQMIRAGESSGSLGVMLSKINRLYTNRYNYIIDNIATMIEPLLIAAIAGFVLVLALGIFLPMWSMVDIAG